MADGFGFFVSWPETSNAGRVLVFDVFDMFAMASTRKSLGIVHLEI